MLKVSKKTYWILMLLASVAGIATAETAPSQQRNYMAPLVKRLSAPEAMDGLDGAHMVLWNSHGSYYSDKKGKWVWQRPELFGTVEDLFPTEFIIDYLTPMLENAGAVVMLPRERDTSRDELVVEKPRLSGKWDGRTAVAVEQGREDIAPHAYWNGSIQEAGNKAVYVRWDDDPLASQDVLFRVNSLAGEQEFQVNQRIGSGVWVCLGVFPFAQGQQDKPIVEMIGVSDTPGAHINAGQVKVGGGMGDVKRGGKVSGHPRWVEGARYYLQSMGLPESVWNQGGDDYKDDYTSRGHYVNYLAGGSEKLPGKKGLGVPIDLSFALHTDAGVRSDDNAIVGTMPIVSTSPNGGKLGDGRSRTLSTEMARTITDEVVRDVRRQWYPQWQERGLKDSRYHEASCPEVPAMILELLSHQNFADMKNGLDPGFQFLVARAIYKGMLKFLAKQDNRFYVVQPLPVNSFAIAGHDGKYRLSWKPTKDEAESSAMPEYYLVQERVNGGGFQELEYVDNPRIDVTVEPGKVYSYRVIAVNTGGASFPSEVLSVCYNGHGSPEALIVNGFTRISGPQQVTTPDSLGFDYSVDMGVPYMRTIDFVGEQVIWKRGIESGGQFTGTSRDNLAGRTFAGNTFDFPSVHGAALAANGWSFVSSSLDAYLEHEKDYKQKTLDLILGKQGGGDERYPALPQKLRGALQRHCDRGGNLLVSGSYIGAELYADSTDVPSQVFASDVLGLDWYTARASKQGAVRVIETLSQFHPATYNFNQSLSADSYTVESPEAFRAAEKCVPIMQYVDNGLIAGTAFNGRRHRAVTLGFPFESLTDPTGRVKLMGQILNFLSPKKTSTKDNKKDKNKKDKKKKDKKNKKKK